MNYFFKISCLSLFLLITVLTFSCIFQVVSATQQKSAMQEYQRKISAVKIENNNNDLLSSSVVSLNTVEKIARENMFVDSTDVVFLKDSATEVVVRNLNY